MHVASVTIKLIAHLLFVPLHEYQRDREYIYCWSDHPFLRFEAERSPFEVVRYHWHYNWYVTLLLGTVDQVSIMMIQFLLALKKGVCPKMFGPSIILLPL